MKPAVVVVAALLATACGSGASAQADAEKVRAAKTLYFDRHYASAREAFEAVRVSGRGSEAQAALYWIARCSENLGEHERALGEYEAYLQSRPADRALAEEARTSRVALAVKLYKRGTKQHLPLLREALRDPSRAVRYFAALQTASLGPEEGRMAVPVLKEIVGTEKDEDLVDRAKLALLRVQPKALPAEAPPASSRGVREAAWIRVRIFQKGATKANVSVNLPVGLAELVFKSLPEDAKAELRSKGYDADTFWARLKALGPTEILTVEGDEGERIQVWIE